MYARVPHAMAQFVRTYGLRHRLWLLVLTDMQLQHLFFDSTEELRRLRYFQWIIGF